MGRKKLRITDSREGDNLTVRLSGRLDTETVPEFQIFLEERLLDVSNLLIDMEGTEYVSSAGLRVLLTMAKRIDKADGDMVVKNVNREVREVFAITGFDKILNIK